VKDMHTKDDKNEKFRDLLEQNYQWPDYYVWKFIVKIEIQQVVINQLQGFEMTLKESGKGNYVSITGRKLVKTTDEVIAVYEMISQIPGVMSL
jgi:uncharacterized protein